MKAQPTGRTVITCQVFNGKGFPVSIVGTYPVDENKSNAENLRWALALFIEEKVPADLKPHRHD